MYIKQKQAVGRLLDDSLEPLEWEFRELEKIKNPKFRFKTFEHRKLVSDINRISTKHERERIVRDLSEVLDLSIEAVEELLDKTDDLHKAMLERFKSIKQAEPLEMAEFIYEWFINSGGKFFVIEGDRPFLFYHGKMFEIVSKNNAFNALMQSLTKLAAIEKPGNLIWYFLGTITLNRGAKIEMVTWIWTDRESDTIYLNLNSPHHKILKLKSGSEPEIIENGTNRHNVLLNDSSQIKTFDYKPDTSEAEGLSVLKSLIMDSTSCEESLRYFLLCWVISNFLIDYFGDRGLLQIIGSSSMGKSKVAERNSYLVFGENYVGQGSGAADVRTATQNPLTFQDNIENADLNKARVNFLLLLANSATKAKAKTGSDTDVINQKLNALCMITSIEPFPGRYPELVNRTFPIELQGKYQLDSYMHDEYKRKILKGRDMMLSAIFKLITLKILPKLESRAFWGETINTDHPKHNKDRMNEHLCMMAVILEAVLEHIPYNKDLPARTQAKHILSSWINYQEEQAQQTAITSNVLLNLFDGIFRDVWIKIKKVEQPELFEHKDFGRVQEYFHEDLKTMFYVTEEAGGEVSDDPDELMTEGTSRYIIVLGTAGQLHEMINFYLKQQNQRNPFDNPNTLGSRLSNDRGVLEGAGYVYLKHKNGNSDKPFYKTIKGKNIWGFKKEVKAYFTI